MNHEIELIRIMLRTMRDIAQDHVEAEERLATAPLSVKGAALCDVAGARIKLLGRYAERIGQHLDTIEATEDDLAVLEERHELSL